MSSAARCLPGVEGNAKSASQGERCKSDMSLAGVRDLKRAQDGIQGMEESGAGGKSEVAGRCCKVSGVGGMRVRGGIDPVE